MNPASRRDYQLTLIGDMDEDFITSYCPQGTTQHSENGLTHLEDIHTDQSGMIGLLRHLHNLGYTILEMTARTTPSNGKD